MNNKEKLPDRRYSVYVIELDLVALKRRKFREANPDHKPGKACLYVGMTSRTPEERFAQHKAGLKSSSWVKNYGKYLRTRLFRRYNPMSYEEAKSMEVELARKLRRAGYAVWQN